MDLHVSTGDLERYYQGIIKDKGDLALLEEHLLCCAYCCDRAENLYVYIDTIRRTLTLMSGVAPSGDSRVRPPRDNNKGLPRSDDLSQVASRNRSMPDCCTCVPLPFGTDGNHSDCGIRRKANSNSGGKANSFPHNPGMLFAMARNDFHKQSGAGHYTGTMNPPKGASECRPGDCPCGNYGKFYASDSNSHSATSRSSEVARIANPVGLVIGDN